MAFSHLIAFLLGGRNFFGDAAFLIAAYQSPLLIGLSLVIVIVPQLVLAWGILFIIAILNDVGRGTIAMKAVYEFGWGKAFVAYITPYVVVGFGFAYVVWYLLNWD